MHLSDKARHILAFAMTVTLALALVWAALAFGATTIDLAAIVYGLGMLLALLWAVKLVLARSVSWKHSPLHLPVAAFALYALVRYFWAPFEYPARLELFQVLFCAFFYFTAACNFYHQRDRALLLNTLVGLAMAEAAYAMWQFYTHAEKVLHIARPAAYSHRGSGTFICPNHLAAFLAIILGLVLAQIAIRRGRTRSVERSALYKVYLIYAALVIIAGIMCTLSRAAMVSTVVGVLAVLLWGDWRQRAMWPRIGVAAVVVIALIVMATRVDMVRDYIHLTFYRAKPQQESSLRDPSFGGRTLLWKATLRMIRDRPVFGGGAGSWEWYHLQYRDPGIQRRPEYAHNDFLNLAADYGLVGLALGLAALGCFYWQTIRLSTRQTPSEPRALAIGALIAMTVILFHSWFDFNLHIPANALLLATVMGLVAALDDPQKRFARVEINRPARFALAGGLVVFTVLCARPIFRTAEANRQALEGKMARIQLDRDEAIGFYQAAADLDPNYPEPYLRLGQIYYQQSIWRQDPERADERRQLLEQAKAAYQQALKLRPLDSLLMIRLAKVEEDLGDEDTAFTWYLKAQEVDPNSAEVLLRLGKFYARVGEVEKAKTVLQHSRRISQGPNLTADLTLWNLPK